MSRRFSSPVKSPSTAENWPVTPIAARTASGSRMASWPAISTSPPSAAMSVDRIWTVVVLPAPFGPEQGVDGALGDREVDAVEDDLLAVGLAQPGGADRGPGTCHRHAAPSRAVVPRRRRSDVEVLDSRLPSRAGDHVEELRRDPLAELVERLDDARASTPLVLTRS